MQHANPAMFTTNHYAATQSPVAAQQQLLQQQHQQLRRTRSQQSPQQQPSQIALQQIPPQGHQFQYQTIPQSHLQVTASPHQKQLQPDQLAYNPNLYVTTSPDHQLLQGLQATSANVNPSQFNPSDLQFQFSQYEEPTLISHPHHHHHQTHPYQGQLTSNSPDPILANEAFRYRQVMQSNGADPIGQRALSPMYGQQPQVINPSNEQFQQQVGNPATAAVYSQEGDWRVNNSQLYSLDPSQYQTGYLGVPGPFQSHAAAGHHQQQQPVAMNHQAQQQQIPQQQHQQQITQTQPVLRQQMISVGPSDDIIETPKPIDDSAPDAAEAKKPRGRKKKVQSILPSPPKLIDGATNMKMDMERLIIFDVNLNDDKLVHPNGSVTFSYEPLVAPASARSPLSVDSPDVTASPQAKKAKVKTAKMKAAKIEDPITLLKERMIKALEDDEISVTKALSLCWAEMKGIAEDDKDTEEKRIAWLKTIFDNGFEELFKLMTEAAPVVKRIRKWMVDGWREDKNNPIILYCLQVYQKLSLDEKDLEEFKLISVLTTISKNARDEKVKLACAHIQSRAAKITAKQEVEHKKSTGKAKTDAAPKSGAANGEATKPEKKSLESKSTIGISKSDSADILKDAAKIASQASEDSKSAKRKPGETLDKDGPSKKFAATNQPSDKPKSTVQLPIAPEASKVAGAGVTAKPKASNEGFFANMQKAAKPKPTAPAAQPVGFTSIFDQLKEREAAKAAAQNSAAVEKPPVVVKKKKSVRWKPDEELNEIRTFKTELPEGEEEYDPMEHDGMEFGSVKAKVRANLKEEAQALKNRNFDFDDEFEIEWDSLMPIKVFWPPDMLRNTCYKRMGEQKAESPESQKQLEREKNVLAAHYSMAHPAPLTPHELPSVDEPEQANDGFWEAQMLRPPPGWKRERNYLFGDSFQKKHMAKAFMPQPAAASAPAPAPAPVSQVDLSSILANLGGGQAAATPAPQPAAPQEPQKPSQLASILATLSKIAPQPATSAPQPQAPQPVPTPQAQANPLQNNPFLALLGIQAQSQQQAPAPPQQQPQLDLAQALQQLTQPQQQTQPQNQINPLANFPFPFPPIPPQPGQAAPFPFMPFPPPLPGQNPAEFIAMYQALMNPQNAQAAQQVQQAASQPGQNLNDVLSRLGNAPAVSNDTKMEGDDSDYQPAGFQEQNQNEKPYQEPAANQNNINPNNNSNNNNNNNSNNNAGHNKEGKGSWSKFGKKKKNFGQGHQPYNKNKDNRDHSGSSNSGGGSKRVCAFWQAGGCLKGDDCQYSHDGPPGQGGSEQADQIRQHLYGKDGHDGPRGGHEKKHGKKFKKQRGYGGSGSAADNAAASGANDWNGEMEY
ncbi:hypothetical protein ABW19_dt0201057 [Dactylella cylindrospora]|nr:hypothetical protein ABW19_dt0201057 [Dactylella cylindrospora]